MAFWEDDTSSRTPSFNCKMKWYRFRTVKSKLHHRATPRAKKAAKRAAPPDQPARARNRGGAPPTCRQRQYVDRGR
eukprot:3653892-Prymnesium_polylepis.1